MIHEANSTKTSLILDQNLELILEGNESSFQNNISQWSSALICVDRIPTKSQQCQCQCQCQCPYLEGRVEAAALAQIALLVRDRREQVAAIPVANGRRAKEQNLRVGRAQAAPALVQLLDPVHELAVAARLQKDGSARAT
jgi:hypothetical protein